MTHESPVPSAQPTKPEFASAKEAVPAISNILSENQRFLICGHLRPDGDCIGSAVALYHYLRDKGKDARIFFRPPVLETFESILPEMAMRVPEYPTDYPADVTLCVDCGAASRISDDFHPHGLVVNIDHHHANTRFGDLNWVDARYAAVGEMIYLLIEADPEAWTLDIATALYLAVVTDTGAFRYTNTTAETFRIAARLVEKGADPATIAARVWGNRKIESCLIAAAVWNNVHFEVGGNMVWSEITQSLFEENGGEANEPDNLVSELIGVNGALVAVLLREKADGGTRASFRGRPEVDVSTIAAELGGGGHRAAAGLDLNEPYAQARLRIIETAMRSVQKQLGL